MRKLTKESILSMLAEIIGVSKTIVCPCCGNYFHKYAAFPTTQHFNSKISDYNMLPIMLHIIHNPRECNETCIL